MKTSDKILEYIENNQKASAKQLTDYLELSGRAVFKQLAKLSQAGVLTKIGTPPKVYYQLAQPADSKKTLTIDLDQPIKNLIEKEYLYITPLGQYHSGWEGFVTWCQERKLSIKDQAQQYAKLIAHTKSKKHHGMIRATQKFADSLQEMAMKEVYYADFYSLPQFGKTKLGQLLLYAKQSQDKKRIKYIADLVRAELNQVIKAHRIEAIGFVPPTVKREVQFMKELEKNLAINLPHLQITKLKTEIIVPQKTLNKLADRITNAQNTIIVEASLKFKNVLLIDDAAGSGATLNETAKKLIAKGTAQKVFGAVIVGSYKGFEVISEI